MEKNTRFGRATPLMCSDPVAMPVVSLRKKSGALAKHLKRFSDFPSHPPGGTGQDCVRDRAHRQPYLFREELRGDEFSALYRSHMWLLRAAAICKTHHWSASSEGNPDKNCWYDSFYRLRVHLQNCPFSAYQLVHSNQSAALQPSTRWLYRISNAGNSVASNSSSTGTPSAARY
jgi:hypothetical protein